MYLTKFLLYLKKVCLTSWKSMLQQKLDKVPDVRTDLIYWCRLVYFIIGAIIVGQAQAAAAADSYHLTSKDKFNVSNTTATTNWSENRMES